MTQQQIEGNKIIAEFMGDYDAYHWEKDPFNQYRKTKYHKSWDDLMSVVEKIEHCEEENNKGYSFHVVIFDKDCHIFEYLEEDETPIIEREGSSKIEATWLAVVDFIKWYNQQH